MKLLVSIIFIIQLTLLFCLNAFAASKAEAETMVKKGITYIKANGKEKAISEFNNQKGQFVKGELYIFVIDSNGITVAHGANSKLINKNMLDLRDAG